MRSSASASTSTSRRGVDTLANCRPDLWEEAAEGATTSSTMLFHAPHCGQRPIGRAAVRPHSWHT